jgi:N-acetylglutamate synthase-like GNAT family acetyltransferase
MLGRDMNPVPTNVRRATVDDIEELRKLWLQARLPVEELERRLTEFQLVLSTTGEMVGAIGLHVQGKQGKLHSEAFIHAEHEDDFRPVLWERVKTVARNHGLIWLWTQELAPFYHHNGFQDADEEMRKKLPVGFGDAHAQWSALQLRDEVVLSLDREFELFHQTEIENTAKVMRQARFLKAVATVIAVVLFAAVAVGLYYLFRQNRLPSSR